MTTPDPQYQDHSGQDYAEPPADSTQVLPPGMFGRSRPASESAPAPAPPTPPATPSAPAESAYAPPPSGPVPAAADYSGYTPQPTPAGPAGNDDPTTFHAAPAWSPQPGQAPAGYGYHPEPASGGSPATSAAPPPPFPPADPPPYAPAYPGHQQYAQATPVVITPQAVPVAAQQSRGTATWLSLLVGLLMSVAGVFLLTRFGYAMLAEENSILNIAVTALGVALIVAAALMNSWSGWATLVPGIVFSVLGGVVFFLAGSNDLTWFTDAFSWAFSREHLAWVTVSGTLMMIGLLLLAASIVGFASRRSGRRSATPAV